ncbi:MAG: dihydroneopterin aldolase [Candidatus Cloacimonetes bacterium]|nr:dihydroneopterin aldolase [Candidatus Cloacimonadota bacterium]MCF7813564.1 dihydroneopterin aldolase [Candidatus Cloacimonadota bacterium]MCF7868195.1 dihydroneopterin aldolase [Candidatus Cloacimonadota bacterium]MCF7883641.1 dihydroneopterin aldolase [Candidatus Cloacimonadota bacterium]
MKIYLNEMIFYGYHGVHPEERKLGQRFIVDFTYESDPKRDKEIKHLEDTIDYTKVFDIIKHTLEKREFHLLEVCANSILDHILEEFPKIIYANVRIRKPSVPINGSLDSVEVEMERNR